MDQPCSYCWAQQKPETYRDLLGRIWARSSVWPTHCYAWIACKVYITISHSLKMIDSGDSLLILAWSLVGVSAIVVSLRFWVRIFRVHYVKADDWCMLIAVVRFAKTGLQ